MRVVIVLEISEINKDLIVQNSQELHFIIMDALSEFSIRRKDPYYLTYDKIYKGKKLREKKEQIKRRVAIADALHSTPVIRIDHHKRRV